jgi:hypothetical protein
MKKMLPNAGGYSINPLQAGVQVVENFSYTFQGNYTLPADANSPVNHMLDHTVEDFENLGVVVWIQDDVTKEILQSTSASLVTDVNNDLSSTNKIMIFPNPTSDIATIAFQGHKDSELEINIVNLLGEMIVSERYTASSSLDYYNLNVSQLNSGIYNVVMVSNGNITTKQLQIIK